MSLRTVLLRLVLLSLLGCTLLSLATCKEFVFCSQFDVWAPDGLVANHEYLAVGRLASIDTLLDLGSADYTGSENLASVVEYAFLPQEILKGKDKNVEMFYLWYCATTRLRDSYTDDLENTDSQQVLVYGNAIDTPEGVALLYAPHLRGHYRSIDELPLEDFSAHAFINRSADSTFITRIMASDELRSIFYERQAKGVVLFTNDQSLGVLQSYYDGELMYAISPFGCWRVSPEEYLQEVRDALVK